MAGADRIADEQRAPPTGPEARAQLRLMATTDLHMVLTPHDPLSGRPAPGTGLALAAAEARRAAGEVENAALFDVGDAFQGNPADHDLMAEDASTPHPMAVALDAAGVDAVTIGNHEFNFGLPALERALAGLRAPVVLANIVRALGAEPTRDTPFLPPFTLLGRRLRCADGRARPIRIGVFGVAPPQILHWDADKLVGHLAARDILEAARAWVPRMRAAGADLVVALCHSGIGPATEAPSMEHAAVPLAALPGIDVVLAGHAHRLFPDPGFAAAPGAASVVDAARGLVHGTPTVMAGHRGTHIGVVDLALVFGRDGWRVEGAEARLRPVTATDPDPAVMAAAGALDRVTPARLARPVGRVAEPIHTYFARVCDCAALRLVNAAQMAAVRAALAGRPEANLPLVSAAAPLRCGGLEGRDAFTDIPAGPITERDIADLYPYPNTLQAVLATGAELRALLERSAAQYRAVTPGARDAPLIEEAVPGYACDVLAGLRYRIDLTAPAGARIRDVAHAGRPVRDSDRLVLATNSFRTGSAGRTAPPLVSAGSCRGAVAAFVARGGAARGLPPPGWGFVPVPDTWAVFRTGPGAPRDDPGRAPGVLTPLDPEAPAEARPVLWRFDLGRAAELGPA